MVRHQKCEDPSLDLGKSGDRKSTRLNSSHGYISYAVFCLKKKHAVTRLKEQRGKDIVVYGGATFVSALLEYYLIDELNIFVNPVAIGRGMRICMELK